MQPVTFPCRLFVALFVVQTNLWGNRNGQEMNGSWISIGMPIGIRLPHSNTWCLIPIPDIWYPIQDTWYRLPDIRRPAGGYQVHVSGIKYPLLGIRYQVFVVGFIRTTHRRCPKCTSETLVCSADTRRSNTNKCHRATTIVTARISSTRARDRHSWIASKLSSKICTSQQRVRHHFGFRNRKPWVIRLDLLCKFRYRFLPSAFCSREIGYSVDWPTFEATGQTALR